MGREYVQQKVTMASLIYALITVASTLSPSIVSSLTSQTQRRPNFVFILADDLDLTLGGASSLPKTSRLIASKGADLTNWFVHTPVCCSSRAEILTGKYFHNLKVSTPGKAYNEGCMHINVDSDPTCDFYAKDYFARYFKDMKYKVGVFGKHLNNYNTFPQNVDRWLVNGGGDYINPSFTAASAEVEPTRVRFENCTDSHGLPIPCYSTSIIGNASIAWIKDHLEVHGSKTPFFAYVALKAPHLQDGPGFPMAIPAPWYQNATVGKEGAPRTPNYNASCPKHHWLVRQQSPLSTLESSKVDELYRSRLRSLLSVDDLVEETIHTLDDLGIIDSTYVIFTSDNGFRFGQFRMPEGKWSPYEHSLRVPFWIRGPGLAEGILRDDILGTHVDLMPTLLCLASGSEDGCIPSTMDGENLAPLLLNRSNLAAHRNVLLIEYMSGPVVRYQHIEDSYNNTFRGLRLIDPSLRAGFQNLKYIEFTDLREDWNFTKAPLEVELFNLDRDPFEMENIASRVPAELLVQLRQMLRKLFACSGESCRGVSIFAPEEESSGQFRGSSSLHDIKLALGILDISS